MRKICLTEYKLRMTDTFVGLLKSSSAEAWRLIIVAYLKIDALMMWMPQTRSGVNEQLTRVAYDAGMLLPGYAETSAFTDLSSSSLSLHLSYCSDSFPVFFLRLE
jgi:hypothetical protein